MTDLSNIEVPIFIKVNGQLQPNTLFHRSFDRLHSRCIEYPFVASELGDAKKILDVGSAKSSDHWIKWLEGLAGVEVYAVDYDESEIPFERIKYYQADVRKLPFEDNYFDKVFAVSVIEHIGLAMPQVAGADIPVTNQDGDVEAVRELTRVLKPGGSLIMTLPFGIRDGFIAKNQARTYTVKSIKKFEQIIKPVSLDYFEYQYSGTEKIFKEELSSAVKTKLASVIHYWLNAAKPESFNPKSGYAVTHKGAVTWRRTNIEKAAAVNEDHTEGVLCGVWRK